MSRFALIFISILIGPIGVWSKPTSLSCGELMVAPYDHILEFEKALRQRRSSYHTSELTKFSVSELTNLEDLTHAKSYSGLFRSRLLKGRWEGQEVFAKYADISYRGRGGLSEASFAKLLSDLGLGPRFYGVIVQRGAVIGYVTEFIDGYPVWHQHRWFGTDLTKRSFRKSLAIKNFLYDLGIYPVNLQYRLSTNGRLWIVDTGEFFAGTLIVVPTEKDFKKALARALKMSENNERLQ